MANICNVPSRTIFTRDNLDILRGINSDCVDLIYLDPPFKSDRTYAAPLDSEARGAEFDDVWTSSDMKQEWMEEIEHRLPALYHLINGAKLAHGENMAGYLTFMSVRLLELHRVLKPTGSIYLHCDPHASHYLKAIMDALFGEGNFQNEVVWKRTGSHGGAKRWGPIHDVILFYSASSKYEWNRTFQEYTPEYLNKYYAHEDQRGRYGLVSLTGSGATAGDSGRAWRGIDPSAVGRHWAVPRASLQRAYPDRADLDDLTTQEKLDLLDEAGLIHWPEKGRVPRQKRYRDEGRGVPIQDVISDIRPIGAHARERTGWRTQKPLALLERIIEASSEPGDLVLDPFCGCATACIAAEKLEREWIGIDKEPQSAVVLQKRARRELQIPMAVEDKDDGWQDWTPLISTDVPKRNDDLTLQSPTDPQSDKEFLYANQGKRCAGCDYELPLHVLSIDHILPRSKGGMDVIGNLQLLCHWCNSTKGNRSMEYLKQQIQIQGIRRA